MHRVLCVIAGLLGFGMLAAPASAALLPPPVRLTEWNAGAAALAVNGAGQSVVAYPHGEHVRLAALAPDGTLAADGRVEAGSRAVDGPDDVATAIDDAGDVVVSYTASNGQQPLAPGGGYGFLVRPWYTRTTWGVAPPTARTADREIIRADQAVPLLRADGTALLVYGAESFRKDESDVRVVRLDPVAGPVERQTLITNPGGAPQLAGTVTGDGGLVVAIEEEHALGLATAAPGATTFGTPRLGALPNARDGVSAGVPVLVDARGYAVLVRAVGRGSGTRVVVTRRRAAATAFGAPQTVIRGTQPLMGAALGPEGLLALVVQTGPHALRLLRIGEDGVLAPPVTLPGRAARVDRVGEDGGGVPVAVDGAGDVLVGYPTDDPSIEQPTAEGSSVIEPARLVRVRADGATEVLAEDRFCSPLGLSVAPGGAGVESLDCSRDFRHPVHSVRPVPAP